MPAEWETHERTLVEWPVRNSMQHPENYDQVCQGYAEVVNAISEFETVTLIINGDSESLARRLCTSEADFLSIPHNDGWCRDNGPTFVWNENHELAGINWQFNAWGEKYKPYDMDNAVAEKVLRHFGIKVIDSSLILEGGSIHVDGEGTLLTTEECLLNRNRNPLLSRTDIEKELKSRLNISKILWLERGLDGDETDGHVDNIACFAAPGKILFQACHDRNDPNYNITLENLRILAEEKDAKGREIDVIPIQQPPERKYAGTRLTLSYLNFYFVNKGIILPLFGGDASGTDDTAAAILRSVFPERKIVTVDGMKLVSEGGNVHCITQQMPMGRRM
jgi:agmatine deiminase